MKKKSVLIGLCICLAFTAFQTEVNNLHNQVKIVKAEEVPVDKVGNMSVAKVRKILQKVKDIDETDNGKMWGMRLDTRIMVVDPDTRKIITTEADNDGTFKKMGNLYKGQLPDDVGIANSTIQYGGKQWAMIIYFESNDTLDLLNTYIHEMFHNIQKDLGLDGATSSEGTNSIYYDNSHMDEMNARIYLKLEWEALHKALNSSGAAKKKAIADALTFRYARRKEYNSSKDENAFEIQEGITEYTAERLVYSTDDLMDQILRSDWKRYLNEKETPTFVRSFAYHSGVLYGLLLDECSSDWRQSITYQSDLGELLRQQYAINLSALSSKESEKRYNFKGIYQYEKKRKKKMKETILKYTKKFIDGPVLQINLTNADVSFNPNNIRVLKGQGSIYEIAEIYDNFGQIVVTEGGVLISTDWNKAIVSSKNIQISDKTIKGKGWTLKMKSGYSLKKQKNGCYILQNK
ncbi:MAG: hypothetical protein ACERKN_19440 [Velocimicrobium sp.]